MGKDKTNQYRHNLRKGSIPSYHIRCMVVGHFGVGKTTLVKGLLEKKDEKIESTDGIDVYRGLCFVDKKTGRWKVQEKHTDELIGLEDLIQIDFWDFAGQALYYTTHPTYFSYRCLYLLTIKLDFDLQTEVEDYHLDPAKRTRSRVIDFLHFWIGSIIQYSGSAGTRFPRIVVIGTHRDKIEHEVQLDCLVNEIKAKFPQLLGSEQLIVEKDLFIDARNPRTNELKRIKTAIVRIGESYPTYGEQIPIDCMKVKNKLKHWRIEKRQMVLTINALRNSLQGHAQGSNASPDTDDGDIDIDDIYLYLELYHSLGQILFMNENILCEKIILDPKWLIEAMRCLITRRQERETARENLSSIGKLKKSVVEDLWKKSENAFHEHSQHLLMTMEKLDLICLPKVYDDQGNDKEEDFYYIPSMVEESGTDAPKPVGYNSVQSVFDFKENLLPPAVFYKVVCHCLTLWSVYKSSVFSDQVTLVIDKDHLLHLRRKGNTIQVRFFYRRKLDSTVEENTKRSLRETLGRILRSYTPAKIHGSNTDWYTITDEGKTKDKGTESKMRLQLEQKSFDNAIEIQNLDDLQDLTVKQLMLVAWDEEIESHDEVQKKIQSDLPRSGREPYRQLEDKEKTLMLLSELKTYNGNRGEKTTAATLCKYIDKQLIHRILHHAEMEVTTLPRLEKQITDQMLDAVAMRIGVKVFPVGILLGLTIDEIIIKRKDHVQDTLGLTQSLLRYWKQTRSKTATTEKLAQVLIEANCSIEPMLKQ